MTSNQLMADRSDSGAGQQPQSQMPFFGETMFGAADDGAGMRPQRSTVEDAATKQPTDAYDDHQLSIMFDEGGLPPRRYTPRARAERLGA